MPLRLLRAQAPECFSVDPWRQGADSIPAHLHEEVPGHRGHQEPDREARGCETLGIGALPRSLRPSPAPFSDVASSDVQASSNILCHPRYEFVEVPQAGTGRRLFRQLDADKAGESQDHHSEPSEKLDEDPEHSPGAPDPNAIRFPAPASLRLLPCLSSTESTKVADRSEALTLRPSIARHSCLAGTGRSGLEGEEMDEWMNSCQATG